LPDAQFPKTSWTLIARAGALTPGSREALSALCEAYWFPVYAFVRRRSGSSDDAYDRTQGFFARLLERNDLAKVDRARGSKFRSWLLKCVKNYLANEHDHDHAQIRRPPGMLESLSPGTAEGRYLAELSHHLTPERLYERHFALSVLARVMENLRARYAAAGKEQLFEALKGCLSGDAAQRPYEEIAAALGMKTVGAVKKAAFDLRSHYKKALRAEVARLLDADDPEGDAAVVQEELRHLLAALEDAPM
jgi:RNA polymerase sigma-70 factor (ECF subfamily)